MNKMMVIAICGILSHPVYATSPEESKLLQSWGVTQNDEGVVTYLNENENPTAHWSSTPIPVDQKIDYSVLPNTVKPLVLYR